MGRNSLIDEDFVYNPIDPGMNPDFEVSMSKGNVSGNVNYSVFNTSGSFPGRMISNEGWLIDEKNHPYRKQKANVFRKINKNNSHAEQFDCLSFTALLRAQEHRKTSGTLPDPFA